MSVDDKDLNKVADEDEKIPGQSGAMDLLLPPPPLPAFGSPKLIHPSLGEVSPGDFVEELDPMPSDARPGTPMSSGTDGIPPFQLPGDEDDPEGHAPAHHTVESEKPKPPAEEWTEDGTVEGTKKYLDDVRALAPDISKTLRSLVNQFVTDGFTKEEALAFAQTILQHKLSIL